MRFADYIFLLARTDLDAPKHQGISYLLVPMKQPGVEVRPIRQIDGSSEFNEVFFSGARCPRKNVVGGENNGWKVAMTTLGFERGASSTTGHRRFAEGARPHHRRSEAHAPQHRPRGSPGARASVVEGEDHADQRLPLADRRVLNGTHSAAALGATHKMFWSEYHRYVMNLAIDILGLEGQILTGPGDDGGELIRPRRGASDYPVGESQASFFFSCSETIWGGTAEIQRNIVGERVLGLPKEPKAAGG